MQKKFSLKQARKAKDSIIQRKAEPTNIQNVATEQENTKKLCPPPTPPQETDILRVTKVFEECRLVETNEVIDEPTPPLEAVDVECLGAELIDEPVCFINPNNSITATFSFVTFYQFIDAFGNPVGDVQVVQSDETRTVFLSRAGEPGLDCLAEVFLECLQCFVSERGPTGEILEVTCCVGKQILFKLVAEVQLLIPTFGYAPVPPECAQVLGECPDFQPIWPPYPPQNSNNNVNKPGCRKCSNKTKG